MCIYTYFSKDASQNLWYIYKKYIYIYIYIYVYILKVYIIQLLVKKNVRSSWVVIRKYLVNL